MSGPSAHDTPFTAGYGIGRAIRLPIAHKDGNYFADEETLDRLEGEGRIAFRYCDEDGAITQRLQSERFAAQHRRTLR